MLVDAELERDRPRLFGLGLPLGFRQLAESLLKKQAVGLIESLDLIEYVVDLLAHGNHLRD